MYETEALEYAEQVAQHQAKLLERYKAVLKLLESTLNKVFEGKTRLSHDLLLETLRKDNIGNAETLIDIALKEGIIYKRDDEYVFTRDFSLK